MDVVQNALQPDEPVGRRSFISAPLLQPSGVRGVVNVNNKRSQQPFDESDLKLLGAIAGHASVSIGNAQQYEAVLERSQRDALTGLMNHGFFWSALDVELDRARRYSKPLTLVMIDVDNFKDFNDRYGHPAGDQALCAVGKTLAANSRSHDVVARYGGEEFAIVLPETTLAGGWAFAEKIRQSIEDLRTEPKGARLTISVGVAESLGSDPQNLVQLADERLYQAKAAGRNQVCAGQD